MDISVLTDRYFALMHRRELDGLAGLFEEDAVLVLPDGHEVAGLAAIHGMYQYIWNAAAPAPAPLVTVAGEAGAATEIEAKLPDGSSRRTANFFYAGANGKIGRVSIYWRGAM